MKKQNQISNVQPSSIGIQMLYGPSGWAKTFASHSLANSKKDKSSTAATGLLLKNDGTTN